MSNWKENEIYALRKYLENPSFGEAYENGIYYYEDKNEGLKIQIKPIGDHNFELTINEDVAIEGALEVVGDLIINTLSFYYHNNDPNWNEIWEDIYSKKDKI